MASWLEGHLRTHASRDRGAQPTHGTAIESVGRDLHSRGRAIGGKRKNAQVNSDWLVMTSLSHFRLVSCETRFLAQWTCGTHSHTIGGKLQNAQVKSDWLIWLTSFSHFLLVDSEMRCVLLAENLSHPLTLHKCELD